jgi:hypothetical protein
LMCDDWISQCFVPVLWKSPFYLPTSTQEQSFRVRRFKFSAHSETSSSPGKGVLSNSAQYSNLIYKAVFCQYPSAFYYNFKTVLPALNSQNLKRHLRHSTCNELNSFLYSISQVFTHTKAPKSSLPSYYQHAFHSCYSCMLYA